MSTAEMQQAEPVVNRLERLSENWWLFSTLTGAVMAGWLTLVTLMIAVVLDMLIQFDPPARTVILIAWSAMAIAALLLLLVRPMLRRRTLDGTARRLEELFPELDSDLINVVQLSRGNGRASKLLQQAAVRQAGAHAERIALEAAPRRLTWRRRFRLCMQSPRDLVVAVGIALGIAVLGGMLHLQFPAWPNAVYRLFHPTTFVPAVGAVRILEVTPGNADLLSGTRMTITAQVENPSGKEQTGELITLADDGALQRHTLVPSADFDRYRFTFPKVTDPFRYRLEIGRTQTNYFDVTVFDRPAIRSMSATYRYPAYTDLAEQTVELKGGLLEAPQYTEVHLKIGTAQPVKTAVVKLGDREVRGTARLTKPLATAMFPIVENGFYSVHLTDERGNTNTNAIDYPIRVTIDQPPTVDIRKPAPEIAAAAGETISLDIRAGDDYGVSQVEFRSRLETDETAGEAPVQTWTQFRDAKQLRLSFNWQLPDNLTEGTVLLYRVVARDNRDCRYNGQIIEPQEAATSLRRIRIVDRESHFADTLTSLEALRRELWHIYKRQTDARTETTPLTVASSVGKPQQQTSAAVSVAQHEIHDMTQQLVAGITGDRQSLRSFKTTLANLAEGRMTEAAELARETAAGDTAESLNESASKLVGVQDDILDVLRKLLDLARAETSKTLAQMEARPGDDLPDDVAGRLQDLSEKLKEFLEEQRKVIEASEDLAKKPVDDFTEEDEQTLKELAATEDDWSRFMKEQHSDLSRLPEQDFSNPSMLEELIEVETELKMAEDALTKQSVEIAVPLEQLGAEMAEEITTNIEKWLPDSPDRERWSQEEPLTDAMREAPMAELPNELEDLMGELMEEEEDLFDEMEDVSSSWADSLDKGAGWDAMDGPISNMSAKGVTGNRLPNTSEIGGRSGEGRQGKSSGEFVGDSAVGKGGRKTPSRLTPDPFEKGQVKDTSKDPVGGATGGGKESGQGGEGLEGPIPPPLKRDLARLAGKQSSLRNRAETIRLEFQIINYNTEDLNKLIDLMKTVEQHLRSGHFRSALRRRDVMLDFLGDLRAQTADEAAVKVDTTVSIPQELRKKILGSMQEESPAGWEQLNKSYFQRISNGQ